MVLTLRPSAHLPCLATRAGLGRITRSSDAVRFAQGGVVKTFRWDLVLFFVRVLPGQLAVDFWPILDCDKNVTKAC